MSTQPFEAARTVLNQSRHELDEAQAALRQARERLERIRRLEAALARTLDPDDQAAAAEASRLAREAGQAEARLSQEAARVETARGRVLEGFQAWTAFTDPRQAVERLSDAFPVLLLPLRLETRMKVLEGPDGVRHQLWVRAYPDDCAVDAFEPVLSEAEVRNARRYWAQVWRAGGDEEMLEAAWRNLVASHGAGRALWIVENYEPLNRREPPPADEHQVVLVIATADPPQEAHLGPLGDYWEAVWRARDDPETAGPAQRAAREALIGAVGEALAGDLVRAYRPFNLDDPPPEGHTRAEVTVGLVVVRFESDEATETKRRSWTRPPRVDVLPDRLVVMGYQGGEPVFEVVGNTIPSPLVVGPDPQAPEHDRMGPDGDDLAVDGAMRWMVDFDEAVRVGMGFRVDLTPGQYAAGFDRLLVLGVRLSADADEGRRAFEGLLDHHHHSRAGLSFVRQGTPTNNTDEGGAGYRDRQDPGAGFEAAQGRAPALEHEVDWLQRADGLWFADLVGIAPAAVEQVQGAHGTDIAEAQAMNTALFAGTLGYTLDTMLSPVLDEDAVEFVRGFFTGFVSGRGMPGALRVGRQPYGILPTTAFSRMGWWRTGQESGAGSPTGAGSSSGAGSPPGSAIPPGAAPPELEKLHEVLMRAHGVWRGLADGVSRVGGAGDPHQVLLDVLGLHATAAEMDHRWAESLQQVLNGLNLQGVLDRIFRGLALLGQGAEVLRDHGYDPLSEPRPEILDKYFVGETDAIDHTNLIHDLPLSETEGIRPYTTDGRDYLAWLVEAARTSLDRLRTQEGFAERPSALLYLMLRHALMLGYYDSAVRLNVTAGRVTGPEVARLRREPPFVHVAGRVDRSESRFQLLYEAGSAVSDSPGGSTVADHITAVLAGASEAARLQEQIRAVERLQGVPTARLERLFVEHLDTCGYRLDAWLRGMVHLQLLLMRMPQGGRGPVTGGSDPVTGGVGTGAAASFAADPRAAAAAGAAANTASNGGLRRGLYLGAFGWLEEVRASSAPREPVTLPDPELAAAFHRDGDPPLERDPANAGYTHAPSPNHAVTAAVLRNGYRTGATPDQPGVFAVNLSSERVRRAMAVVQGIRRGQSLGALLGYQLERGLHDRHGEAEVDAFIYGLRKAFPLVADHMADTARAVDDAETDTDETIETVEARNVVDGAALVEHVLATGNRTYPFGKSWLPDPDPEQSRVINEEVERLLDTHDAVADLGIAEGIHQVVQGNYDRTAATVEAFSGSDLPPVPEVVTTPRSGVGLTHRVGLHLPVGLGPDDSPSTLPVTPRAAAEPALNHWLAGVLPAPEGVGTVFEVTDRSGHVTRSVVTQAELGLQPIDLLYLVDGEADQAMGALDDLIAAHARQGLAPDAEVAIRYTEPARVPDPADPAGDPVSLASFFQVAALVAELRPLVLGSRPLRATDVALPGEADPDAGTVAEYGPTYQPARLEAVRDRLTAAGSPVDDLRDLAAELEPLVADPEAHRSHLVDGVDHRLERFVAAARSLSMFGLSQAGFGFALEWRRERYRAVLDLARDLMARWEDRLVAFDDALDAYDLLDPGTTDEVRFEHLEAADRLVAALPASPRPASPEDYRLVLPTRRFTFTQALAHLTAIADAPPARLWELVVELESELDEVELFDLTAPELERALEAEADRIVWFSEDLLVHARNLVNEVDEGVAGCDEGLAAYVAAGTAREREEAFSGAAHALLGPDFLVVPEFRLLPHQALELEKAWGARHPLLEYLETDRGVDFPVDDWLYGVARVRQPLQRWEGVTVLAEALAGATLELEPLQLPYRDGDRWLALEFPEDLDLAGERLLYTAHFGAPFDGAGPQCGLLLDEWTEVLPADRETTGVAFHYDRPGAEPPQVMLLATPPVFTGAWAWRDLVDTLHETLELARLRAVEPDHVAGTDYARFVPATIAAVTRSPITIGLNLALVNHVFSIIDTGGSDG